MQFDIAWQFLLECLAPVLSYSLSSSFKTITSLKNEQFAQKKMAAQDHFYLHI